MWSETNVYVIGLLVHTAVISYIPWHILTKKMEKHDPKFTNPDTCPSQDPAICRVKLLAILICILHEDVWTAFQKINTMSWFELYIFCSYFRQKFTDVRIL